MTSDEDRQEDSKFSHQKVALILFVIGAFLILMNVAKIL